MAERNKTDEARNLRQEYEQRVQDAKDNANNSDTQTRASVESRLELHVQVLEDLKQRFESEGTEGLIGIEVAIESSQNARTSMGGNASINSSARANAEL